MKLKDALYIIRFNTGSLNELSGKSINTIFSNRTIIFQLMLALNQYAEKTKAIEDIYSLPLSTDTEFITAPTLALRSETYRYAMVWQNNIKWILDGTDLNRLHSAYRYQAYKGIPRWFVGWSNKLYIHPNSSITHKTTTLNGDITATDTTITLTDASNFLTYDGRITIDNEKIIYTSRSGNVLSGCERGVELTTAAAHTSGATVEENNMWIFYRRLHREITITDQDYIPPEIENLELEVPEEHIKIITNYVSYLLLAKVDTARAAFYKLDFDKFIDNAEIEIISGRIITKKTGEIRDPYIQETDVYYPYI